jgi:hypothetical protein
MVKETLDNEQYDGYFRDRSVPGAIKQEGTYIRIYPLRPAAYEVPVWSGEGDHGGGDAVMLDDLFLPEKPADKYLRASDQRGGAYSIISGRGRKSGLAWTLALPGRRFCDGL